MSSRILIGKKRHQSRSDRERGKLQAQIHTYALRHRAAEPSRTRALAELSPAELQRGMDSFIGWCFGAVDRAMASAKKGRLEEKGARA